MFSECNFATKFTHQRQTTVAERKREWIREEKKMFYRFCFLSNCPKISDQRTKPWLLSGSPGPLLTILMTYLYFCLYAGPRYMKDRKPFELKKTLIVYNIIQVILSVALVFEVSMSKNWNKKLKIKAQRSWTYTHSSTRMQPIHSHLYSHAETIFTCIFRFQWQAEECNSCRFSFFLLLYR